MKSDDERFDRRSGAKAHPLGHFEDASRPRLHLLGVTARNVAEAHRLHCAAPDALARATAVAFAACQVRHHDDRVAAFESAHALADFIDDARKFMAHDRAGRHLYAVGAGRVQIGAADAAVLDPYDDLPASGLGVRHLDDFERRPWRLEDTCSHSINESPAADGFLAATPETFALPASPQISELSAATS
jgi:hypothetical protein